MSTLNRLEKHGIFGHRSITSLVCAVGALLLALPSAQAQWNQTNTGPYTYSDTNNWDGGVIGHQFTNNLDASQTVQLTANADVTNLTWARSSTSSQHHIGTLAGSGGTRTLTLNGTTRYVPYLNFGSGNQRLDFASTLALDLVGENPTLVSEHLLGPNNFLYLNGAVLSGSAGLTTRGDGLISINGANTLAGPLNIEQGQVRLSGANGALPNITNINVAAGARFELGNSTVNNNRLADNATINLNGGLGFLPGWETYGNSWYGNFMIMGDDAANNVAETVGTINAQSGLVNIAARVSGSGTGFGNTMLNIGNLTRSAGSAIVFSGGTRAGADYGSLGGALNGGTGAQSYITFATPPTMTNGILPYAVVGTDFGNVLATDYGEFATYDAINGIVPFGRTGTYVTSINAATAGDNVRVTTDSETWVGERSMNSLTLRSVVNSGGTFNSAKITLMSGGLTAYNQFRVLTMPALDFNNQEAFIFHRGPRLLLNGALTSLGANGLNLSAVADSSGFGPDNTGAISFNNIGNNSISVPTRVLMGTLDLTSGDPLGVSAVTVAQGGTLSIPTGQTRTLGSLAGEGMVRLSQQSSGAAGSTLVVGGNNASTTFSGEIHAGQWAWTHLVNGLYANPGVTGGNVVKTGTGTLTLSGLNTYNGSTTVRQGTLVAAGDVKATAVYGGGLDAQSAVVSFTSSTLPGNLANGDRVVLQTRYKGHSGWIPGQLYYVVEANGTTFKIADTPGGTAKTIANQNNQLYAKLDTAKLASSAGGDTLTLPAGWSLEVGDVVVFNALPPNSALRAGIPYYIVHVSGSDFKVSTYAGGSAVRNLPVGSFGLVLPGVFGTGTNTIEVGDAGTGSTNVSLLIGGPYTVERAVSVSINGTGTATLGGNTAHTSTFSGVITLGRDAALSALADGQVNVSGLLTGAGGVTKAGAGVVVLVATNDYQGATTVSEGDLRVNGALAGFGAVNVATGAVLSGSGTIAGAVTIEGYLAPGASAGLLTINSNVTFASTATFDVELGGTTPGSEHDQLVVNDDLGVALDGTLRVTLLNSYDPPVGSVFTVMTCAAIGGNFASTNLPALTGKAWTVENTGTEVTLTVTTSGGSAPTVGPVTLFRTLGQPLHVLGTSLATNSFNAEGGGLSNTWVSATSSNGYPVYLSGPWVFYVPNADDNTTDYFNFRLANTNGVEAESTATVLVSGATTNTLNVSVLSLTNGIASLRWAGLPGRTNEVEAGTQLGPVPAANWSNIGQSVVGELGFALFAETNPPSPRYYRIMDVVP